jgi:hypothetical protein
MITELPSHTDKKVLPMEFLSRNVKACYQKLLILWIKKMWYLYTMEYYSAMKKNEILSFSGKWMELENIILDEVSQAKKTKKHMFFLICGL